MRFVIFGGTTEGRELSRELAAWGGEVTVCVATDYGSEVLGHCPGVTTLTGRLTATEMAEVVSGAALCIDATHPYAKAVTAAAREACAEAGAPYRRLLRAESPAREEDVAVDSAAAAAAYLVKRPGNILLAIGVKELAAFTGIDPKRLFPRILPSCQGLAACEDMGIPHGNIIAMQGPFSEELNLALLRQFSVDYLVTKDGGAPGGFREKQRAAQAAGVTMIVIRRPEEQGESYAAVLAECRALLGRS